MIKYFVLIAVAIIALPGIPAVVLALQVDALTEFYAKNTQMVVYGWFGFAGACLVLQFFGDLIGARRRKKNRQ